MLDVLGEIANFFFSQINCLWLVYTSLPIVSSFFALWVFNRIFHIFDILKR